MVGPGDVRSDSAGFVARGLDFPQADISLSAPHLSMDPLGPGLQDDARDPLASHLGNIGSWVLSGRNHGV